MNRIKKLGELLNSHIKPDSVIIANTSGNLTAPGENYGSLMLALEVKLKNSKNEKEVLAIAAKLIPENLWLRDHLRVKYTFPKEMNFYAKVIPSLVKFQMEQGMENTTDIFAKYYGGRLTLDAGSDQVDEDGVILLENLKNDGYITVDRIKCFGKESTEVILENLAIFHAVPLAAKIKKPEMFENDIKPHINYVAMFETLVDEVRDENISKFEDFARESDDCKHLVERVSTSAMKTLNGIGMLHDGPFATITHNDFWVNNIMLKFDNGKPASNKIIDFQLIDYGSPGKDLVFFLFTSVQMPVLEQFYDHFLNVYYDTFIRILKELHCDVSLFSFEAFERELEFSAKHNQFFHCMFMNQVVFADSTKDLNDLGEDDFHRHFITEKEREKGQFIIREFAKRNWI